MKEGCSICGGIILADTEDWGDPLCYAHWYKGQMSKALDLIYEGLGILEDLKCETK